MDQDEWNRREGNVLAHTSKFFKVDFIEIQNNKHTTKIQNKKSKKKHMPNSTNNHRVTETIIEFSMVVILLSKRNLVK